MISSQLCNVSLRCGTSEFCVGSNIQCCALRTLQNLTSNANNFAIVSQLDAVSALAALIGDEECSVREMSSGLLRKLGIDIEDVATCLPSARGKGQWWMR